MQKLGANYKRMSMCDGTLNVRGEKGEKSNKITLIFVLVLNAVPMKEKSGQ